MQNNDKMIFGNYSQDEAFIQRQKTNFVWKEYLFIKTVKVIIILSGQQPGPDVIETVLFLSLTTPIKVAHCIMYENTLRTAGFLEIFFESCVCACVS